jgi:hypothetical protein
MNVASSKLVHMESSGLAIREMIIKISELAISFAQKTEYIVYIVLLLL